VASLEAKLKATSQALKEADAAKASADKVAKAAEARAIKAENSLAEVSHKQADVGMPFGYPRISILGPAHYGGGHIQGLED
jgi:hypothetical protein